MISLRVKSTLKDKLDQRPKIIEGRVYGFQGKQL